jgi:polysaccharide transporter, PST family
MIARLRKSAAARNFGWLVADRGVRLMVGVVVTGWVARYLGKQNYGLLNYSMALVAIFAALTPLGMDSLTVREIIKDPKRGGRWIGTIMGFRSMAAMVAAVLAFGLVFGLRHGDPLAWMLVATLSLGILFQSLESGELWFQAHTQMRRLVVPRLVLFLCMNVLKIIAVRRGAGVVWFSVLTAAEQVVSGGITWIIVRRSLGSENRLSFDASYGWNILKSSWPLAVSALSIVLYMKLSQLVLSGLMGDAALGVYAAAIRIPEAATFLPTVLATSILPSLVKSRSEGAHAYHVALRRFFRINALLALSICIPVSLAAPWIIRLLFGPTFSEAAPILSVYVWSLLFVFLGVARSQHLLNELLTHLPMWFSGFGLLVNLGSCLILIPMYGAMGAAVATVLSQCVSAFLSSFIHPKTRGVGREQWLAMITPWRIQSAAAVAGGV